MIPPIITFSESYKHTRIISRLSEDIGPRSTYNIPVVESIRPVTTIQKLHAARRKFDDLDTIERIIWLIRNDQPKFVVLVLAVIIFVYLTSRLTSELIFKLLYVTSALAADEVPRAATSYPDISFWVWMALAIVVLGALGAGIYVWIKESGKKSDQGYNIVQSIVAAALGFLAGKHS
jgi:hypothetical protein